MVVQIHLQHVRRKHHVGQNGSNHPIPGVDGAGVLYGPHVGLPVPQVAWRHLLANSWAPLRDRANVSPQMTRNRSPGKSASQRK